MLGKAVPHQSANSPQTITKREHQPIKSGDHTQLQPALLDAQVPPALHRKCIEFLLDSFRARLDAICLSDPLHFHVVNSLGTLGPADWANELHPTAAGFKKIAEQCWKPVLQRLRLAA